VKEISNRSKQTYLHDDMMAMTSCYASLLCNINNNNYSSYSGSGDSLQYRLKEGVLPPSEQLLTLTLNT